MTISKSIKQAQLIVQQLSKQTGAETSLLHSLSQELVSIQRHALKLTTQNQSAKTAAKPEMKSGCYVFAGEKAFFCPNCYDNLSNKVPTKRLNSKLRVCPICRMSIQ